jgi:hypothetical protein
MYMKPTTCTFRNTLSYTTILADEPDHISISSSHSLHSCSLNLTSIPAAEASARSISKPKKSSDGDVGQKRKKDNGQCIGRESNPGLADIHDPKTLRWQRPILPLNHQCS